VVWLPNAAESKSCKMNILSKKILIFCVEQIVKLLSQMKRSSVSDCDFFGVLSFC